MINPNFLTQPHMYDPQVYMSVKTPELVAQQLQTATVETADISLFFSNFMMNVPNGRTRQLVNLIGDLDGPRFDADQLQQRGPEGSYWHSEYAQPPDAVHSWQHFFDDFDRAIAMTNVDTYEVERLRVLTEGKSGTGGPAKQDLNKLLAPVYLQLREQGYSYGDLIL